MPASELTEWVAFDSIEPFGEQRADLRAAIVASTTANYGMRELKKPKRPKDFMPFVDADEPILLPKPADHAKLVERSLFGGVQINDVRRRPEG